MARYTTEQLIAFPENRDNRIVTVNGSLEVYVYDGVDFILSDTLATGSFVLFTRGSSFKFTPLSGSYAIEEGVAS